MIPLAGMMVPVLIVGIVFFFIYQQRRFLHQERLAMIEKGLAPDSLKEMAELPMHIPTSRSLTHGVVTAAIGLALLLGLGTIGWGPWLLGGLIPLAVGIGIVISYLITPGKSKDV